MAVGHVPNEHLAVKGVTCGHQKAIVMGESQIAHFMVVLR